MATGYSGSSEIEDLKQSPDGVADPRHLIGYRIDRHDAVAIGTLALIAALDPVGAARAPAVAYRQVLDRLQVASLLLHQAAAPARQLGQPTRIRTLFLECRSIPPYSFIGGCSVSVAIHCSFTLNLRPSGGVC